MDQFSNWRRGIATILGIVIFLVGVTLGTGGFILLLEGGSFYYLIAGLGLIASGIFLFRGSWIGALVYAAVFLITLLWAFWEADGNNWALVPRLVAPLILMIGILLVLPALNWKDRKASPITNLASFGSIGALVIAAVFVPVFYGQNPVVQDGEFPLSSANNESSDPGSGTGVDWLAYGGTKESRRYSRLDKITADNVDKLEPVWTFHTGDMPKGELADSKYGAEMTPLKVGNSVFICSAKNILISLEPGTGREKWRYDPKVPDENIPYTAACRSVTYYERAEKTGGQCDARIIEGTLDGRIIAVDSETGQPCTEFGDNGQVDMTIGMGESEPGMVAMTSPLTIVQNVIVTNHQVKDGISIDAPSGVLQGFDAVTGQHLWAWDMNRPDLVGRPNSGDEFSRGTPNSWTATSGDEDLGLVYVPMGNSAGDYISYDRSDAELKYATALVAMDVKTGKPRWHFQTVYNDVWDYDLGSQASLIDFEVNGQKTPALILPSKQGDIYILDRRTGKLLTGAEDRPVPQGGVPEEVPLRAKTQLFSTYHTLAKPVLKERDMWGMTLIDQMVCRIKFRKAAYNGMYTPPTADQHWIQYPGYNGGSDWGGVAVDPVRGVIIANYNDMPNYNRLVPRETADKQLEGKSVGGHAALAPQKGAKYAIDVNAGWRMKSTGLLCKEPPYGGLRAINSQTGKTIWDRPYGTARNNGPWGIPSRLPFTIGTPNNGGSVVTAGGLIFISAATDDLIKGIDIQTGETLWSDVLPGGGQATPMTYEHEGRQYVLIMAGGHHFMETKISDVLVAYALPD
jgi:quinoprotein glucose dehydrogenase